MNIKEYFKHLSDEKRQNLIFKTTGIALILGILLSFNLWHSDRQIPLLPLIGFVPDIGPQISRYFLYIVFFALISAIFFKSRKALVTFLILFGFLLLQDQLRWQPWVYIYSLILLVFVFQKKSKQNNFLVYFQILIIGIYFWSGIHKLQTTFINNTFVSILENLFKIEDVNFITQLKPFGHFIPIIEILTAVFLYTIRFRFIGIILAISTHFFSLVYLSPLGLNYNNIVYPWNIAMICFVLILFYQNKKSLSIKSSIKNQKNVLLYVLLAWILPALNLSGYWDHYLSFSLYSNKPSYFYIESELGHNFSISSLNNISRTNENFIFDKKYAEIGEWTLRELNVPFYPEDRVFQLLIDKLCLENNSQSLKFLSQKMNKEENILKYFDCK